MIGRLHLKLGVSAHDALRSLRALISDADAVTTAVGPDSGSAVREAYVRWIENVESQLAHLTRDRSGIQMLHTERYWHIRAVHGPAVRPLPLVTAELDLQKAALVSLADDLDQRVRRLSAAPGEIAVLDTNVVLHYQEPPKIRWGEVLGSGPSRLMIPLRVVENSAARSTPVPRSSHPGLGRFSRCSNALSATMAPHRNSTTTSRSRSPWSLARAYGPPTPTRKSLRCARSCLSSPAPP